MNKPLLLLILPLVALALGCGESTPPLPTAANDPHIKALVADANLFLDEVEAQPPAQRRAFLQQNQGRVASMPLVQPEIRARLNRLLEGTAPASPRS
ncbi:hypothetical protein EON81_00930 [bacterium]|nr:MAG: hypothetical protein EON81_00930 [bacterium]